MTRFVTVVLMHDERRIDEGANLREGLEVEGIGHYYFFDGPKSADAYWGRLRDLKAARERLQTNQVVQTRPAALAAPHRTWDEWPTSELVREVRDRMRHFYAQTDGTMAFPNSAEGDLLKLVHTLVQRPALQQAQDA